jgi:hypothetical protein
MFDEEQEPESPAVQAALRILSRRDEMAALAKESIKEACKEALRHVLTFAKLEGPVHDELRALVLRTQERLDTHVDMAAVGLVEIAEKVQLKLEKKAEGVFNTLDRTISRAVNDWMDANAKQVIRATITQFLFEHPPSYTIIRDVKLMSKLPADGSPAFDSRSSPPPSRKARLKSQTPSSE